MPENYGEVTMKNSTFRTAYYLIYGYEDENPFHLIKNQYLLLKDPNGSIIDTYKCNGQAWGCEGCPGAYDNRR